MVGGFDRCDQSVAEWIQFVNENILCRDKTYMCTHPFHKLHVLQSHTYAKRVIVRPECTRDYFREISQLHFRFLTVCVVHFIFILIGVHVYAYAIVPVHHQIIAKWNDISLLCMVPRCRSS